jgi:hypothetical protein
VEELKGFYDFVGVEYKHILGRVNVTLKKIKVSL